MNGSQRRRRERLERASAFADANAADFPETSKGGQAAAEIKDALAKIERHETSRASSLNALQQAKTGRKDERELLRALLRAISSTAKIIGVEHPEVRGGFKFKGASISDQTLLATARAFSSAALPIKDLFIEYDMAPDFHEELNLRIANFEQYLNKQTAQAGERVAANASLESELGRGAAALERYHTAVTNKYRKDPAKLAAWERARHLERAPHKKNGDANGKKAGSDGDGGGATPHSNPPPQ